VRHPQLKELTECSIAISGLDARHPDAKLMKLGTEDCGDQSEDQRVQDDWGHRGHEAPERAQIPELFERHGLELFARLVHDGLVGREVRPQLRTRLLGELDRVTELHTTLILGQLDAVLCGSLRA